MSSFPYQVTGAIGTRATLGLVVLQVDETIEQDFRRLFPDPGVALYTTRIPSGAELTVDTIAAMEAELPRAAALLPPAATFDAVAYACTSGTTLIGAGRVAELVGGAARTRAVANPLTATLAAFQALGVRRPAIVSPYVDAVAGPVRAAFTAEGLQVSTMVSFGEEIESRVARIDPASIHAAALQVGRAPGTDAVFLSCTNLRTLDIIPALEAELGLPVISSNQALAWHMARLAHAPVSADAPGRVFRTR